MCEEDLWLKHWKQPIVVIILQAELGGAQRQLCAAKSCAKSISPTMDSRSFAGEIRWALQIVWHYHGPTLKLYDRRWLNKTSCTGDKKQFDTRHSGYKISSLTSSEMLGHRWRRLLIKVIVILAEKTCEPYETIVKFEGFACPLFRFWTIMESYSDIPAPPCFSGFNMYTERNTPQGKSTLS